MSSCKRCGASTVRADTTGGRRIALDTEPVASPQEHTGPGQLYVLRHPPRQKRLAVASTPEQMPGSSLYTCHFDTCEAN